MKNLERMGSLARDLVATTLSTLYRAHGVRSQDVNLYLNPHEIAPRAAMTIARSTRNIAVPRKSLHVFADLAPLANWGHDARHLFFNPTDGRLMHSEFSQFPPPDFAPEEKKYLPLHVPQVHSAPIAPPYFLPQHRTAPTKHNRVGRQYAILFSGASNNRHVNDMEFLFRTLCDRYSYDPERIYVLNHDGTLNYDGGPKPIKDWPGDATPYRMKSRIVGKGDKKGFDDVFAEIAKRLKPSDSLLIHTNNHGGDASEYGEPWLCGYPDFELVYKASEFGNCLAHLPKFRSLIVGMEQCYSGGFMAPTISNSPASETSFASAVPADKPSIGGPSFDPWALDWIAAFHGTYPDGTALKHPVATNPSSKQAFDYSSTVHHPKDDPVFQDAPTGAGASQYLS